MPNNNPYAAAAGAYGTTATTTDSRQLEVNVLLKSAKKLEDLSTLLEKGEKVPLEDIGATLEHNRKLWQLFLDEMMNDAHPLPIEIKNNVASLAVFIFKRTQDILIDTRPEKLKVLIDINRNIATGLAKRPMIEAAPVASAVGMPENKDSSSVDSLA